MVGVQQARVQGRQYLISICSVSICFTSRISSSQVRYVGYVGHIIEDFEFDWSILIVRIGGSRAFARSCLHAVARPVVLNAVCQRQLKKTAIL